MTILPSLQSSDTNSAYQQSTLVWHQLSKSLIALRQVNFSSGSCLTDPTEQSSAIINGETMEPLEPYYIILSVVSGWLMTSAFTHCSLPTSIHNIQTQSRKRWATNTHTRQKYHILVWFSLLPLTSLQLPNVHHERKAQKCPPRLTQEHWVQIK